MEAYINFSELYDIFMDNVPYDIWKKFLKNILKEHNVMDGTLLELGCGTGTMTELLAAEGYDMIGVDYSAEMLTEAMNKRIQSGHDILYLNQDMREFELFNQVDAVICICDSLNYLTEQEELIEVFARVRENMVDEGVFIFDFNTEFKYAEILGEQTIAENREEGSFIWENFYDKNSRINEYELTLFIREDDDTYRRYKEYHYQRAYNLEEIERALVETGFEVTGVYDDYKSSEVKPQSERICVVARKKKE
ncbi:methyltransferase domain-containing protein [Lachnospiraceae bacterium OttesenSCG-928-E19]|nr:methyltransferase domain-containing protein [Lachnospiraceae bacterium OttesenSCG-928-E19]